MRPDYVALLPDYLRWKCEQKLELVEHCWPHRYNFLNGDRKLAVLLTSSRGPKGPYSRSHLAQRRSWSFECCGTRRGRTGFPSISSPHSAAEAYFRGVQTSPMVLLSLHGPLKSNKREQHFTLLYITFFTFLSHMRRRTERNLLYLIFPQLRLKARLTRNGYFSLTESVFFKAFRGQQ